MHITHLLSLPRPSDIAKALPNLPRGLEKTYDEIFDRIMSQEEGLRDIALRTFHWMLSQDGTSDLEQLLVAVCQDPGSDEVYPVDIDPDVVLKACHNLVVEEGRYDSAYKSWDDQDRDDSGSMPPNVANINSGDIFAYAFTRMPLHMRSSKDPDSVSRRFPTPALPPPPPPPAHKGGPGPAPPPSRMRGGPGPPPPPPANWPGGPPPWPMTGGGAGGHPGGPPVIVNLTRSRSRSSRRKPAKGVLTWMAETSKQRKSSGEGMSQKTT